MHTLPMPALKAVDAFDLCTSGVRNKTQRAAIEATRAVIETDSLGYVEAAKQGSLHALVPRTTARPMLKPAELKNVYTSGMVRGRGRVIYEQLLAIAKKCPLCTIRNPSSIDHHLPKSHFPVLSVTPANLIPCCYDCNIGKGQFLPGSAEEQTLHPYFDDLGASEWLAAKLHEGAPGAVEFSLCPSADWGHLTTVRAQRHFEMFGIGRLYASAAADEMRNIAYGYARLHSAGGSEAVQSDLTDRADSAAAASLNSWRVALYRCLASSTWYCDGGFAVA